MEKKFQIPQMEVTRYEVDDVIATSGNGSVELPGDELPE